MSGNEQQDGDAKELADLQRALASVYKVERLLVRHGTTVAYEGTEINPPRPVALRVFPAELGLAPAAARFREAVQAAVRLSHANLVPIYRMGTRAGTPYFVAMKLVEGRPLSDVIASQGPLQVPIILAVLRAVASAVAYAHGQGMTHGALRGTNVLLDRSGQVAVAEIGFARVVEEAAAAAAGRSYVTAPEEAAGGSAGPAGDQYALGLIALEMLTGTAQAAADPLAADPLGALHDVRAARVAIPDTLVKVVQTALARDPTQRFPSAADLLAAIEAIPFSDADGREAMVTLGRLARGEPVPKVRALSPPTAAVPRVSGGAAASRAAPPAPLPEPTPAAPTEFAMPAITIPAPPPAAAAPEPPALELAASEPEAAPTYAPPPPPPPPPQEPVRRTPYQQPAMPPSIEPERVAPIMRASRDRESGHLEQAAAESVPKRRSPVLVAVATLVALVVVGGGGYLVGRMSVGSTGAPTPAAGHPAPAPTAATAPPAAAESPRADTTHTAPAAAESAKAGAAPAAVKTGVLLLDIVPRTAYFFVDGKQVGRRGSLAVTVPAGRRHVEAVASGFVGLDTMVIVPAGDTLDMGEILLDSTSTGQPAKSDTGGH